LSKSKVPPPPKFKGCQLIKIRGLPIENNSSAEFLCGADRDLPNGSGIQLTMKKLFDLDNFSADSRQEKILMGRKIPPFFTSASSSEHTFVMSRVARFFLVQHTETRKKIPNDDKNVPNGHKIYQLAVIYTKRS
jgi:hypothetical protein